MDIMTIELIMTMSIIAAGSLFGYWYYFGRKSSHDKKDDSAKTNNK
ncbi:MAG: hypothetical protein II133_04880 [Lachnospiraceae bacterium]|nr:hypothetical protein [Lachnospiraceae bacterium]